MGNKEVECRFYKKNGSCYDGDKCPYKHIALEKNPPIKPANKHHKHNKLCRYFKIDGVCPNEDCPFLHEKNNDKLSEQNEKPVISKEPVEATAGRTSKKKSSSKRGKKFCHYFESQSGCRKGDACPQQHYRSTADAAQDKQTNKQNNEFLDNAQDKQTSKRNIDLPDKSQNLQTQFSTVKLPNDNPTLPVNSLSTKITIRESDLDTDISTPSPGVSGDKHFHIQNTQLSNNEAQKQPNNIQKSDNNTQGSNQEIYKKSAEGICKFFLMSRGCFKGDKCRFYHLSNTISDKPDKTSNDNIQELDNGKSETSNDYIQNVNNDKSDIVADEQVQNTDTHDIPLCLFYLKERGCLKGDKCNFKHEVAPGNDENIELNNSVIEVEKEVEIVYASSKAYNKNVCSYFMSPRGCLKGEQCNFVHPSQNDISLGVNEDEMKDLLNETKQVEETKIDNQQQEQLSAQFTKSLQVNRVCKYFLTERGCIKKDACEFLHSIDPQTPVRARETSATPISPGEADFKRLRSVEIRRLEKRFKNGFEKCEMDTYVVNVEPTDPDWPFVVKNFYLRFQFPANYPVELFHVSLQDNDDLYPPGFVRFMNVELDQWRVNRERDRSDTDTAFLPFIKWFDRNLQTLFSTAATKVKQLRDAALAGITLIRHEEIQVSQPPTTTFSQEETTAQAQEAAQTQASSVPEDKTQATDQVEEANALITDNKPQVKVKKAVSDKVRKGTEVKFTNLVLSESVGTVQLTSVTITVQCIRCKKRHDAKVKDQNSVEVVCSKCNVKQSVAYYSQVIHQYSPVLGYLHLDGCIAFDLILQDCIILLNCLQCSKDTTIKSTGYGKGVDHWCHSCHTKMNLQIPATRFNILKTAAGEVNTKLFTAPKKRVTKDPSVKDGEPLPNDGVCKHYKKSFRWLRFPCCGKVYACDVCHDEVEDHEMEYANRMLCGFCAKEQTYSKDKACIRCGGNMTRAKSSHWEGGKGCRNQAAMSRGDKRKTAGLGKTISKKQQPDGKTEKK